MKIKSNKCIKESNKKIIGIFWEFVGVSLNVVGGCVNIF
jgi:hypothetical protein